jgi:hypothetical protein
MAQPAVDPRGIQVHRQQCLALCPQLDLGASVATISGLARSSHQIALHQFKRIGAGFAISQPNCRRIDP